MKRIILIIYLLVSVHLFGQLNGSYTVGNTGDDYVSITSAISAIQSSGMSGSVELIISNGVYPYFNISSIVPPGNDSLYIRSASNNPDSVVFYLQSKVLNSERIRISNISLLNGTNNNISGLLFIENSQDIKFENCKFIDDVSLSFSSINGMINLKNSQNISFNFCFISSFPGHNPSLSSAHTFYSFGSSCSFYKDSIFGDFDYMLSQFKFNNTYLEMSDGFWSSAVTLVDSCKVIFNGSNNYRTFNAQNISNCIFEGLGYVSLKVSNLSNSILNIKVFLDRQSINPLIVQNVFNESFSASFTNNLKMYKNSFFSDISLSPSNEAKVINNFFYGSTLWRGHSFKLYHNNFGENSDFLFQSYGDIINNNLYKYSGYVNIRTLSNNNYFSSDFETRSSSTYDSSPSYYDPQYVSSMDLHITNPALLGKAIELVELEASLDFDGEIRGEYRAMGADDKCLDLNLIDSIYVECGREYPIVSCLNTDSMALKWKPGSVFVDSNAIVPIVKVDGNTLVWLVDSLGNKYDSILFLPSQPFAGENLTFHKSCGSSLFLSTLVTPNSTVSWEPSALVSDSVSNTTWVTLDTSITFVATVDMGVCGVKADTFNLVSDPTPSAFLFSSFECLEGSFDVYVNCYDSLLLEFGDGDFSDLENVTHLYAEEGIYQINLTVWHEGIVEFKEYELHLADCSAISEKKESSITLYPNPVKDYLKVKVSENYINEIYTILNINGSLMDKGLFQSESLILDVQKYPKGIYFFKISDKSLKFIKH